MSVIRFILFLFGICLGMAAAIAALPLPGKTFFNRMSKLPRSVRSLIDNGIDLAISITQLMSSIARDLSTKTSKAAELTKEKFAQIKRDIEIQRLESESLKYRERKQEAQKEAKI
jgi:gas vesicle protein